MKSERGKVGIIICIILIVLLIAGCGALYYFGFMEKGKKIEELEGEISKIKKEQIEEQEAKAEEESKKDIKKIEKNEDLVYTANFIEKEMFSFNIPNINIDSADIKSINSKINSKYNDIIEKIKEANSEEELYELVDIDITYVNYDVYVNGNVLSLIIEKSPGYDYPMYEIYNVDIYTGKEVSNSEILASKNISESEFIEKAKTECLNCYKDIYSSFEGDELYNEELAKVSNIKVSIDDPIFLNLEGNLCVIELIPSLAGAQAYYRIVNLGI